MNVYKKLLEARKIIREHGVSKDGKNKFANYQYFTPDGVKAAVGGACQEVGLVPIFSLERDELGLYGLLRVVDIDDGESIDFKMSTAIPEIKATNVTQQVGGCITYTERYSLMVAFEIADNRDDFDAQDNSGKGRKAEEVEAKPKSFLKKKTHISSDNKPIKPSKEAFEKEGNKSAVEIVDAKKENADPDQRDLEDQISEEEAGGSDELSKLKAECDELGIKYTGRHKESGLKKLISEHNALEKSSGVYEAEEDDDDDMSAEDVEMAIGQYEKVINAYTDHKALGGDAKDMVQKAIDSGIPDEYIAEIKAMVNDRYETLKG